MIEDVFEMDELTPERLKILVVGMLLLWFITLAFGLGWALCTGDTKAISDLGSWFGILNSLFSGVALLGAVVAIILQRHDIKLTISEQRESKEAHADNAASQRQLVKLQALSTFLEVGHREKATVSTQLEAAREMKCLLQIDEKTGNSDGWITAEAYGSRFNASSREWVADFMNRHPELPEEAFPSDYRDQMTEDLELQLEQLKTRFATLSRDLPKWSNELGDILNSGIESLSSPSSAAP